MAAAPYGVYVRRSMYADVSVSVACLRQSRLMAAEMLKQNFVSAVIRSGAYPLNETFRFRLHERTANDRRLRIYRFRVFGHALVAA